jgi:adenosylcobinamide kinase / adenosylcobinamide-phosphate guanylyltransferase
VGVLTFLVGGARSGKSNLSVEMGVRHDGPVVFVATAEPFDDDMRDRIGRHRDERPDWPTIEEPVDLAGACASADPDALLIVDCLTVWVGNLFAHESSSTRRAERYAAFIAAVAARPGPTVVVSNEVGLGIHPEHAMAREYRDELGRLNQAVAATATTTLFLVAGRAVRLESPWDLL